MTPSTIPAPPPPPQHPEKQTKKQWNLQSRDKFQDPPPPSVWMSIYDFPM